MTCLRNKAKGFSLLEVLLVLAIMATIMVSILGYTTQKSDEMRRDRTVVQIEQILNAGLSYYVSFGSWPTQLSALQGNFLPNGTIQNPWGQDFSVGAANPAPQFFVCTTIIGKQAYTAATTIAGRLPMASAIDGTISCPTTSPVSPTACGKNSQTCTIVSSVNIPGQNLNNARSVNFAGLYHNGACVPAPVCPSANMVPSIMVVPVSVSGMNIDNTTVYPISSFTAYATGDANGFPVNSPNQCSSPNSDDCYQDGKTTLLPKGTYWRVCMRIITEKGVVNAAENSNWAQDAALIMALTRCAPSDEDKTPSVSGSQFNVFISD